MSSDIEDTCNKDRIAIIDPDRCKPQKCGKQCIKTCPVVRQGSVCIDIDRDAKDGKGLANIAESLCIGCGMCVKACPFNAIKIVNIAKGLARDVVHRYGPNSFKLHKLPDIKRGMITGILGQNGLGKSTILSILARETIMNYGNFNSESTSIPKSTSTRFKGTNLQAIAEGKVKHILKPQNMSKYQTEITVGDFLDSNSFAPNQEKNNHIDNYTELLSDFDLTNMLTRTMQTLSGGELQRVLIAHCCLHGVVDPEIQLFLFDEPTSFLDLKQRIIMSNMINKFCCKSTNYTVVVDHDMSILDYLSEIVVILYGERAVYGVCALPLPVGQGINQYMDGYLSKENVRFRKDPFKFHKPIDLQQLNLITNPEQTNQLNQQPNQLDQKSSQLNQKTDKPNQQITMKKGPVVVKPVFSYAEIKWSIGDFNLKIEASDYMSYGITVLLGENGFGKTSFVNLLSTLVKTDDYKCVVAHKDQYIDKIAKQHMNDTVEQFIGSGIYGPNVMVDIVIKLGLDALLEHKLGKLSGGELQKVLIVKCLLETEDIYLFDEPSAFLDAETRLLISKIIRRRFEDRPNTMAFVIEHDILMSTYLADRVIIFEKDITQVSNGTSKYIIASRPLPVQEGMNSYMKSLNITLRKDQTNFRHRINKLGSTKDIEQKKEGKHYD